MTATDILLTMCYDALLLLLELFTRHWRRPSDQHTNC